MFVVKEVSCSPFTYNLTLSSALPCVVSGALPAGISIGSTSNPSGTTYRAVISGTLPTPASETAFNFTVRATDAQGQTTDQALSITVEVGIQNAGGFC